MSTEGDQEGLAIEIESESLLSRQHTLRIVVSAGSAKSISFFADGFDSGS